MARSDPLDVMRLMRRIEMDEARHRLGRALQAERHAAAAETQALGVLAAEKAGASAADYAKWLPAGQARLARATQARSAAEAALAPALDAVVKAGTADRVLMAETARRAVLLRKTRLAEEQTRLDDMRPGAISRPEP